MSSSKYCPRHLCSGLRLGPLPGSTLSTRGASKADLGTILGSLGIKQYRLSRLSEADFPSESSHGIAVTTRGLRKDPGTKI